ncbi:MAG: hypothetical protein IT385_18965 [Deltaproteobacteria bacterium]|nr:hypothetical protein [Deltaproteobacteria bacterium]
MWEDVASAAAEVSRDVFGRSVTYTPAGSAAVEGLAGQFTPAGQFIANELGGNESGLPRVRILTADLEAAGITPTSGDKSSSSGDVLDFEVGGEARTYRVVKVSRGDRSWTTLWLARLS